MEDNQKPHFIVIGNEKGGAGKTTTSMHLLVSLLHLGFKVNSIDVDSRQKSLTRYLENRKNYSSRKELDLLMPKHYVIEGEESDLEALLKDPEITDCDFLLIDTPGSHTKLSNYAHSLADTIITPINDSFLDLDVIAQIEADSLKIVKPSIYSQTIWEQKMNRAKRDQGEINWLIIRNRLSHIDAKNKSRMEDVLTRLANRLGFRVAPGFNERVIYRELFLHGLTLLDIKPGVGEVNFSLSHVAAKQELNNFLRAINVEKLKEALDRN